MRLLPPQLINALRERPTSGEGDSREIFPGGVSTAVDNPSPCEAMTLPFRILK